MSRIGILPLGRPTFDVSFAEACLARMLEALDRSGHEIVGPRELLFDAAQARRAVEALKSEDAEQILILQVTFTDASMTVEIAAQFDRPLSVWAIPEPRIGGRLRLNSFCGLNLAGHALGRNGRPFSYLYAAPDAPGIGEGLDELLAGRRLARPVPLRRVERRQGPAADAVAGLRGARIGRIGLPPDGFDTCLYDAAQLAALAGVSVEDVGLETLFSGARSAPGAAVAAIRDQAARITGSLDAVNQDELDRSLRLKAAIEDLKAKGGYDAFAIRCWPEAFTEYGGAVCGPVSMMGEARVPCACEADVYGALTTLLLQRIAGEPAFLADLVDLDEDDDTGVVWHCGQAPPSMADPDVKIEATIHTNRKMPLLFEFPLKPGRVTFFRISQARGETFAVIGGGEMLKRPMSFTGTSGVVRFDSGSKTVLERVMGAALEHHMALVYGDHRDALAQSAGALGIPVLDL